MFYIAHYPVCWTVQIALHFTLPPARPVLSDTNSASLESILAMQQLCANTIQSHFHHYSKELIYTDEWTGGIMHGENENAHTSKRSQRGFEPRLSWLRVQHSATELPCSTGGTVRLNVPCLSDHGCFLWRCWIFEVFFQYASCAGQTLTANLKARQENSAIDKQRKWEIYSRECRKVC